MNLLEKIKKISKHMTEESEPEHGFVAAVRDEIEAPLDGKTAPRESTVEDVVRDLNQRKQKGIMPRNPSEVLMDVLGKPPASEVYASGAVFKLVRQYRDHFLNAVKAADDRKLFDLFRETYSLMIDQPEIVGLTDEMFNKKSQDTDPLKWKASCASTPDGDAVALCCIPVQNKTLSARFVGIVFIDAGDRYYYCMLNRDAARPSVIMRSPEGLPVKSLWQRSSGNEIDDRLWREFIDFILNRKGASSPVESRDY